MYRKIIASTRRLSIGGSFIYTASGKRLTVGTDLRPIRAFPVLTV